MGAKRRGGDDGHHGHSWKVAFADFAIAMMALFMVLWLVAATNAVQKKAISNYFANPGVFRRPSATNPVHMEGATTSLQGIRAPLNRIATGQSGFELAGHDSPGVEEAKSLSAELSQVKREKGLGGMRVQVAVRSVPKGVLLTITESSHGPIFPLGSSALTPFYEDYILALSPLLRKLSRAVVIIGHSDATPFSGHSQVSSNWSLGGQRAETVRRTLQFGGVPASLIIGVLSLGDGSPIQGLKPDNAMNRRVELLLLNKKGLKTLAQQWNMAGELTTVLPENEVHRARGQAESNQTGH